MMASSLRTLLMVMGSTSVLAGGCADDPEPAPYITATATITHQLAVDGCDYLVTIDDARYAPDEESRVQIDESQLGPVATVTIGYAPTGKTGEVECGDRVLLRLPEISLDLAHLVSR